jgi:outer membrane murein-binding lipoprotein Lpp
MNACSKTLLCSATTAFLMGGCAVPQPALDQANGTANLVQELHAQVTQLRTTQGNIAADRKATMEEILQSKERFDREAAEFQDIEVSDDSAEGKLFSSLQKLSDTRAQRATQSEANLAELDAKLAKLLAAVPDTDKAFVTVQKELSALGLQRNSTDRRNLAVAYLSAIRSDWETAKTPTVPTGATPAAPAASAAPAAPAASAAPAAPVASAASAPK